MNVHLSQNSICLSSYDNLISHDEGFKSSKLIHLSMWLRNYSYTTIKKTEALSQEGCGIWGQIDVYATAPSGKKHGLKSKS